MLQLELKVRHTLEYLILIVESYAAYLAVPQVPGSTPMFTSILSMRLPLLFTQYSS